MVFKAFTCPYCYSHSMLGVMNTRNLAVYIVLVFAEWFQINHKHFHLVHYYDHLLVKLRSVQFSNQCLLVGSKT